ncbi:related to sterol O-acyltransferase/Diacylglycerol O-acyltransferase [Ramularia collo-cygni]|uniref:O-acyltransferase n=1 Tax=Ramularia collo-cygni TaxID=112498 RepID=A0A2D3VCV3_9PEZI|nr:related to sterol O-acyltransferase/Diacylglycerol O-acyltransferase [Ramularia collo-cygni]CZT20594.1 related to sterol O-acyltransferase/Diacylglycerol O-acyltransferase [Ramularia collo-cygni]
MSNGTPNGLGLEPQIHSPRARKPINAHLVRASHDELPRAAAVASGIASERNTPAPPEDAPPSVKATSAARQANRRMTKKGRMFPTVDYEARVSYFDPNSTYSNFRGFFVLFWIGLAIMVVTTMLRNLRENGTLLNFRQYPLFRQDMEELAVSDGLMVASSALSLPLHLLFKNSGKGLLRWNRGGMVIQSIYQALWLWVWISLPFLRDWSWTAQVFFTLHTLCIFMKMHSYAFYNGHLSSTLNRLKELDMPIGPGTPTNAAFRFPSARLHLMEIDKEPEDEGERENISPIIQLRNDLAKELTSPMGNVTYPQNLTLYNFADYVMCPTLCYELEYPRTPSRSYLELFWKTLAVFGCVSLLTVVSEEFIIPVLDESQLRLLASRTWIDSSLIFAETVSRMLFPFMVTFLLVFLVIFEYVLGAFAEITCFADRKFYSDWWNSLDWLEFSREWNVPVHNFFRRHVYSASRSVNLSRPAATGITFLISALAHELIMGCITRKFRGYGFTLMMMQMPIVAIQRMPWVRDQQLLNNIMFWISMITGLSLLCALYVLI